MADFILPDIGWADGEAEGLGGTVVLLVNDYN